MSHQPTNQNFHFHSHPSTSTHPFRIAWLASDTSASFTHLATAAADVSITYHAGAEAIAVQQGFVSRVEYAWRDHWMLVGMSRAPPRTSVLDLDSLAE